MQDRFHLNSLLVSFTSILISSAQAEPVSVQATAVFSFTSWSNYESGNYQSQWRRMGEYEDLTFHEDKLYVMRNAAGNATVIEQFSSLLDYENETAPVNTYTGNNNYAGFTLIEALPVTSADLYALSDAGIESTDISIYADIAAFTSAGTIGTYNVNRDYNGVASADSAFYTMCGTCSISESPDMSYVDQFVDDNALQSGTETLRWEAGTWPVGMSAYRGIEVEGDIGNGGLIYTLGRSTEIINYPDITMTSPCMIDQQCVIQGGDIIEFAATASDAEDGDLTGSIEWVSSIDGALGTGGTLTASLSENEIHIITMQVSDSDGHQSDRLTELNVLPPGPLALTEGYSPPVGHQNAVYYWDGLRVSGGRPPYMFAVSSGFLPFGLTLQNAPWDYKIATIWGAPSNPTAASGQQFTVQVTDNVGTTATLPVNIRVLFNDGSDCTNCHAQ